MSGSTYSFVCHSPPLAAGSHFIILFYYSYPVFSLLHSLEGVQYIRIPDHGSFSWMSFPKVMFLPSVIFVCSMFKVGKTMIWVIAIIYGTGVTELHFGFLFLVGFYFSLWKNSDNTVESYIEGKLVRRWEQSKGIWEYMNEWLLILALILILARTVLLVSYQLQYFLNHDSNKLFRQLQHHVHLILMTSFLHWEHQVHSWHQELKVTG